MHIMAQLPDVNHPVLPFRPITGRYLAHAKHSLREWGFIGADLVLGRYQLVQPTIAQAAHLAHQVNETYVHWALQRQNERVAIEAGLLPLVPPKPVKMLPVPVSARQRLAEVVAEVGADTAVDMIAALGCSAAA
jgi:hypothetical protein